MDFVTFIQSLGVYFADSDNAYLVLYAVVTCLLTQVLKKFVVDKIKVDILNKFDFATVLPFIFGIGCACIDEFWVKGVRAFNLSVILQLVVTCIAVGSFATILFKFVNSLWGQSLSSLLKDDIFKVLYTQLLYFGNVRQRLLDKTLTLKDFIEQVKQLAEKATSIYGSDDSDEDKRSQLTALVADVVDDSNSDVCINSLNEALLNTFADK